MIHKLMVKAFGLALVSGFAISAASTAGAATSLKLPAMKTLTQITLAPLYLEGLTNHQFATGSNSFETALKKDGTESVHAQLKLAPGAEKEANLLSKAPGKTVLSLSHIAGNKTTEKSVLAFKGSKASEVGTRVLTFESRAKTGSGRMVAKVQQEQLSQEIWKTTAAVVQFIPDNSGH